MTFLGMNIYQWISIMGVPSIITIVVNLGLMAKKLNILMKAQQAQMRSDLLDKYHYYMEGGWISDANMAEWENGYQAYHTLGANGILDSRREDLLKLPNRPQTDVAENEVSS